MPARTRRSIGPCSSSLDVGADERHQDDVDLVIARNRDALNVSIGRSREEIERGVQASRTIDDIIAKGRKRYGDS